MKMFPFLQTSEISYAAFIYKMGFFQAHPECSLLHVSQNISLVKINLLKSILITIKRFILMYFSISPFITLKKNTYL